MSTRWLLLVAAVSGLLVEDARAQATSVTLQLFPFTGEVRLLNENPDPFSFTFYSLDSPSGALDGSDGVWKSIADTYDVSGNGFIDPVDDWIEFDASSTSLSEGVFSVAGGSLPAYRSISLGKIWNPNMVPSHDIMMQVVLSSGSDATVIIRRTIDGDYLRDNVVDAVDYQIWKAFYGSSTAYFADGNIDGIVDASDYTIWRDSLGLSLPGSGEAQLGAAGLTTFGVPEPSSVLLWLAASAGWLLSSRRRLITDPN